MWGRFLMKKSTCCTCFLVVPMVILYYHVTAPVCGRRHPELCKKYKYHAKKIARPPPTTPKMEPTSFPDTANKMLIYGSYRSGSSLISEFFFRNPDIAYMFEPLNLQRQEEPGTTGPGIIRDMLSCEFNTSRVAKMRPKWLETEVFCHFEKQTPGCVPKRGVNRTNVVDFCRSRHIRVVKVNRLANISRIGSLMRQGLKVLHIIRDQRSLLLSRKRLYKGPWFRIKSTAEEYCRQQVKDYTHISELLRRNDSYKSLYHMVRFEDIVMNPRRSMKNMYQFLGVSPHESVRTWSNKVAETLSGPGNITSPLNSLNSWRLNAVMASEVHVAQDVCVDFMRVFGYRRLNSESELADLQYQLVLPRQFNLLGK